VIGTGESQDRVAVLAHCRSPRSSMDITKQKELIHQILHPNSEDAHKLLEDLRLARICHLREQVLQEIEEKLLLPRNTLRITGCHPIKCCDNFSSVFFSRVLTGVLSGIGSIAYQSRPCCSFSSSPPPTSFVIHSCWSKRGGSTGYVEVVAHDLTA